MTKTECFGILFDDGSPDEITAKALSLIGSDRGVYAVTPNPEIVLATQKDSALREAIESADLILPDGIGLLWASKILGRPLRHRFPGIDFASGMLKELAVRLGNVFLLGARPGIAQLAGEKLARAYPGLRIAGTQHGYFAADEEALIIDQIRQSDTELLFVCLGSPKQELWMKRWSAELPGVLMIGLGGALDVFSGRLRRAPQRWQKLGLEWLYRLLQEPKRFKRMIRLPEILWAAMTEKGRKEHEQGKTDRPGGN